MHTQGRDLILVFADDWGRHPSSCQHIISVLLPSYDIVWVNTVGTRPFRLDRRSIYRVGEKLSQWLVRLIRLDPKVALQEGGVGPKRIINPIMLPSFKFRLMRKTNEALLTCQIKAELKKENRAPIVVTTLPIVADIVDKIGARKIIYYCVDDFSQWPGYDGGSMEVMELDLLPKVHSVVVVGKVLGERLKVLGYESTLITHGVDLRHWQRVGSQNDEFTSKFLEVKRPCIVFWGVIDKRMDLALLYELDRQIDVRKIEASILLIGPTEDPEVGLYSMKNVFVLEPVPFEVLPAVASIASVLIMPYNVSPTTNAMQPLKLKEYLATKKPVVVRDLPATRPWSDCCDVCRDVDSFVESVLNGLSYGISDRQIVARGRLSSESWEAKANEFRHVIEV